MNRRRSFGRALVPSLVALINAGAAPVFAAPLGTGTSGAYGQHTPTGNF